MINQKYAFTIKFKIIKYKLKMLKMRKNMTTLYALLKLVNKNCKCSLCDKKQNLVYETKQLHKAKRILKRIAFSIAKRKQHLHPTNSYFN